jgi:hypothetical protein
MTKFPPQDIEADPFTKIVEKSPDKLSAYMEFHRPIDNKGRYQHYNDFRFRIPNELDIDLAWSVVKKARECQLATLISIGDPAEKCKFMLTPTIQKAISAADRNASTILL